MGLLQLSCESEDNSPNSWIWISGKNYRDKINEMIKIIIEDKKYNKKSLIKELLKEFKGCIGPIERTIYGKNNKVPIPILKKLLKRCNNTSKYRKYFIQNATHIFTCRQNKVNVINKVNIDLAEIFGAFAADGNLTVLTKIYGNSKIILEKILKKYNFELNIQKDRNKFFIRTSKIPMHQLKDIKKNHNVNYSLTYSFELVDSDKEAIINIKNKIESLFGIDSKLNKKKGAWSFRIYNKILARYLRYFGFNYGRKTETVREPQIIKNKSLETRLAFARGVLTFDGSVKYSGETSISLKNKNLIKDISQILDLHGIKNSIFKKNLMYTINIDKNNNNSLSLFIPGTKKWNRLNNHLNGYKTEINTIEEAKQLLYESYDKYNRKSITFNELLNILILERQINSNKIKDKNTAFYAKLRILERMNIIKANIVLKRDKYGKFKEKFKIYNFNDNIKKWRLPPYSNL